MAETWQVVSQKESSVRGPSGQFEDTIAVTFKTAAGHVGHVDIPKSEYGDTATVSSIIDKQATQMDTVGSLTGAHKPLESTGSKQT